MNNIKLTLVYFLAVIGLLSSCTENEEVPKGEFAQGVFVVNEGNFSSSNGSVSFYDESSKEVSQDIFALANEVAAGGLIQSLYFHGDRAFIIDNLGSKIYVVNAETFELIHTIEEGFSAPRYMTVLNGLAYVTNWGPYDANFNLTDSYVSVFDLETYEETSSIPTDQGSEGVVAFGGLIYVANANSNTIDVIDPTSESVVSQIEVMAGPMTFAEDKDGKAWVLSQSYDPITWEPKAGLTRLDLSNEEILVDFSITGGAKSLVIDSNGENLYYIANGSSIIKTPITAMQESSDEVFSGTSYYGLGIHPTSGQFYVGNAGDFESNGTVQVFDGAEQVNSFPCGVTPNGFVFR